MGAGEPVVGPHVRVPGIFPGLIYEPLRRTARVFDEPVVVEIAKAIDPIERGIGRGQQFFDEADIRGPVVSFT